MTLGDTVRSAARGAMTGYGLGQQVGAAAEAVAAMPHVQADGRVAQMRRAQTAGLPREAPGPRTAMRYLYRAGNTQGRNAAGGSGTEAQRDLMEVLHRDAERIRFARNRVRLGAYGDLDPTLPPASVGAGTLEQIRQHTGTPAQARNAIGRYLRTRKETATLPRTTRPRLASRPAHRRVESARQSLSWP